MNHQYPPLGNPILSEDQDSTTGTSLWLVLHWLPQPYYYLSYSFFDTRFFDTRLLTPGVWECRLLTSYVWLGRGFGLVVLESMAQASRVTSSMGLVGVRLVDGLLLAEWVRSWRGRGSSWGTIPQSRSGVHVFALPTTSRRVQPWQVPSLGRVFGWCAFGFRWGKCGGKWFLRSQR